MSMMNFDYKVVETTCPYCGYKCRRNFEIGAEKMISVGQMKVSCPNCNAVIFMNSKTSQIVYE